MNSKSVATLVAMAGAGIVQANVVEIDFNEMALGITLTN